MNSGHGGNTDVHPIGPTSIAALKAASDFALAEFRAGKYDEPVDSEDDFKWSKSAQTWTPHYAIEHFVDLLVDEHLKEKETKRLAKYEAKVASNFAARGIGKMYRVERGNKIEWIPVRTPGSEDVVLADVLKKHPGAKAALIATGFGQ